MLAEDDYTNLVAGRMFEFFSVHSPWHVALWSIGTGLALDEVVEYSNLTREGAFRTKDGLKYVAASARRIMRADPGDHDGALQAAVLDALDDQRVATEAGCATLTQLAERMRLGYLTRLAAAARSPAPPGVEALASAVASHLLDLGFSAPFPHSWHRNLVSVDQRQLHIADLIEEAALHCTTPLTEFDVVVPFEAVPGGYAGPMPAGWLDAPAAKAWLDEVDPTPAGDHRQAGALRLSILARALQPLQARPLLRSRPGWLSPHARGT